MFSLVCSAQGSQIHRDKVDGDCQGLEGIDNRQLLFNWYRVSVGKDEEIMEMDYGDGCTSLQMS